MGTTRGLGDLNLANRLYAAAMGGRKYQDLTREEWRRVWQRRPVNGQPAREPAPSTPQERIEVREEPRHEDVAWRHVRAGSEERDLYRPDTVPEKHHGRDPPIHTAMSADAMPDKGQVDGYALWRQFIKAVENALSTVRPPNAPFGMGTATSRYVPDLREGDEETASEGRNDTRGPASD
jgi:hypothetical protein